MPDDLASALSSTSDTPTPARGPLPLVDPVAIWRQLSDEGREHIGAAAVAHMLGMMGSVQGLEPDQGWAAADLEGAILLEDAIRTWIPQALDQNDQPVRPDLSVFGIATCHECGCTDRCGCQDGCSWAEPDLCSSCVDRADGEDGEAFTTAANAAF